MADDDLLDLLHARSGVVCAVGAGGKKSTLYNLVERHPGKVALTASVFIARFPERLGLQEVIESEDTLEASLETFTDAQRLGFAAPSEKPGRYAGVDPALISRIHRATQRDVTFVKADGARMRWIKAPREGEPVIPANCTTVICVASARALGEPLSDEIAHRVPLLSKVTGVGRGDRIEPEHLARLMTHENGLLKNTDGLTTAPVINMVDDEERERLAREAAEIALSKTDRFDRVVLATMRGIASPVVDVVERS